MNRRLPVLLAWLERLSGARLIGAGTLFLMAIGLLDYATGYEVSFSLFYLLPIALVSWSRHPRAPTLISAAAALTWLVADLAAGQTYSHAIFAYWNAAIRFGVFIATGHALAALRSALERERRLARVDALTGALNPLAFHELAELELARTQRAGAPLALACLDVDAFKAINDAGGHAGGDEVLRSIVQRVRRSVRVTDHVARLGGDEFAILLPATDEAHARDGIGRVQAALAGIEVDEVGPVTVSIGVIIFRAPPASVEAMLRHADALMYEVKRAGKAAARFRTLE